MRRLAVFAALVGLFMATAMLAAPEADATEVPMPAEGITVQLGSSSLGAYYSRPLGPFTSWVGLRWGYRARQVALPLGLGYPLFETSGGRYTLYSRAELAPTALFLDDLDLAVIGTLGLDNRWDLQRLGLLAGLEMDYGRSVLAPYDSRARLWALGGVGLPAGASRVWWTGRVGYLVGGVGRGGLVYGTGVGISRRF